MDPHEWQEKVGRHIVARRQDMYRSRRAAAKVAGIDETGWRNAEAGTRQAAKDVTIPVSPSEATRRAIARALEWPNDAIDRLEAGDLPSAFERQKLEFRSVEIDAWPTAAQPGPDPVPGFDLEGLSRDDRALVQGFIEGIRAVTRRQVSDGPRSPSHLSSVTCDCLFCSGSRRSTRTASSFGVGPGPFS